MTRPSVLPGFPIELRSSEPLVLGQTPFPALPPILHQLWLEALRHRRDSSRRKFEHPSREIVHFNRD